MKLMDVRGYRPTAPEIIQPRVFVRSHFSASFAICADSGGVLAVK